MSLRTQRRSCDGKQKHPHQGGANIVLRRMRQEGAIGMEAYKCPFCPYWHIGHKRGTNQRSGKYSPKNRNRR